MRSSRSDIPLPPAINPLTVSALRLPPVRHYVEQYTLEQINALATHASRYFGLYHPSSCIEIAHTSRYSHRTGKSELCILATRILSPGTIITALKGSMAPLTDDDHMRLIRTDVRHSDTPKDFSIIHSPQMNKDYLFLGPARFSVIQHDCDNNCELSREGKHITFRVLRSIAIGKEITVHYGDGYFGRENRHCLCTSCEKAGRGGYAPNYTKGDPPMNSESDLDSEPCEPKFDDEQETLVLNEKRTRRRAYPLPSTLTPLSPIGPPRLVNLRTHQNTRGFPQGRAAPPEGRRSIQEAVFCYEALILLRRASSSIDATANPTTLADVWTLCSGLPAY
ncbi:hypothetical protein B0H14DRAFT_2398142 [Mycena olivaceomarginata]|nr:hypothetical protein B0H14DRAFT_2398142 [Mycena olivaceomarginata]